MTNQQTRYLNDEEKSEILKLYSSGDSINKISQTINRCFSCVKAFIVKNDLLKNPEPLKTLSRKEEKEIAKKYSTGNFTYKSLGDEYDVSITRIQRITSKEGVNNPKSYRSLTEDEKKKVLELYNRNCFTKSEICGISFISMLTLNLILQEVGINVPKPNSGGNVFLWRRNCV